MTVFDSLSRKEKVPLIDLRAPPQVIISDSFALSEDKDHIHTSHTGTHFGKRELMRGVRVTWAKSGWM